MDKDKLQKKRGSDSKDNVPSVQSSLSSSQSTFQQQYQQQQKSPTNNNQNTQALPEVFNRLLDYKDRETAFLKAFNETITMDCKKLKSESEKSMQFSSSLLNPNADTNSNNYNSGSSSSINMNMNNNSNNSSCNLLTNDNTKNTSEKSTNNNNNNNSNSNNEKSEKSDCELLREECENYIMPLLNRTGPSISAALVAYDAFEQLNRLHALLDQMLTIQEQNYQMRRYLRDVRTLCELKKLQKKELNEPLNEADGISDTELDLDNQVSLLSTILAAGNSASTKRSSAKRQRERSKSVIADDIQAFNEKDNKLNNQRRQSAFSDTTKAKVSKWTKVKAAFKWERANVPALNEGKSFDSGIGLIPANHEVARYLRVPSVPCAGSSADSVLSSSSGHLLSCGSIPATPGTVSSASSTEDFGTISEEIRQNRDSSKSDSRCDSRTNENENRRSRSLDGDGAAVCQSITEHQKKDKTAWRKVKDIIQTHRGSFKGKTRSRSIKSNESFTCSRDVSPCESLETVSNFEDRTESLTSPLISPTQKNLPSLNITYDLSHQDKENISNLSSSYGSGFYRDDNDSKLTKTTTKGLRKSKVLSDFESLPEGVVVDLKTNYNKLPPSPLSLSGRQDLSDTENFDLSYSPTVLLKSPNKVLKTKQCLGGGNSSVPSSPSRHSEFFGEFESEELSSGDFSEPCTPHRKLSSKSSLQSQQDEINEKYIELKYKLNQEFELKRQEWEKIRSICSSTTNSAFQLISKDESLASMKNTPPKSLEDNLSADFKRKLHKWRIKKQFGGNSANISISQTSPTKENEPKKIDWNLWKTGQIKLEGQGLQPLPDQKNLPEEFQKKLEQWKKMKETNSVPAYINQDSLKRKSGLLSKSEGSKKGSKDEVDRAEKEKQKDREKSKVSERDKLEKLSKLKAIVADPRAKEIEVQTSKGVMKFEGISRKFTRKLYEWEKARGIGPEMSTFALLHPGYRPLDVGNGSEESKPHENSPTLGRSLSLDSISPNTVPQQISHQTSSLSLNDMDELKDNGNANDRKTTSNPELNGKDQQDEPEAVIVEVEDDIIETAAPLVTAIPIVEQQTPVYKYESSCSEICAGKKETFVQNIVTHSLAQEKLSTKALQSVSNLTHCLEDDRESYEQNVRHVQNVLLSLKESLPELERCTREGSPSAKNALEVAKKLIKEIMEMLDSLGKNELESKESLAVKSTVIDAKLRSLQKSINLVCKYIDLHRSQSSDQIPEINVTSDDGTDKSVAIVSTTPTIFQSQVIINQPKILMGIPSKENIEENNSVNLMQTDIGDGLAKKMARNASNGSKKKIRLRKMGSRQNSKTESDSTSDEESTNVTLEAPRRVKRKTSRAKKLSDEEKRNEEQCTGEDIVYVLKIKPGQVIQQTEIQRDGSDSKVLISPTESCVQLMEASQENLTNTNNVFVKTKRKIFTAIEEPTGESKTAIAKDVESTSSTSDRNERESSESEKSKSILKSLPPMSQSTNSQKKFEPKVTPPKEPSPSIKMMIAKYNQKIATENISQPQTGSSVLKSPVAERRVREQKTKYEVEHVVKSASAGNVRQNGKLIPIELSMRENDNKRIYKSCSADISAENVQIVKTVSRISSEHDICAPSLACDSLQMITKNSNKNVEIPKSTTTEKKEHLYRKNKEKPTTLFSKTGAIRKIETRNAKSEFVWRRCLSGTYDYSNIPDKSDNTIPKITRKLDSRIPRETVTKFSTSAPTTPSEETDRPKTPLSERALKLQKAKEEFLRASPIQLKYPIENVSDIKCNQRDFDHDTDDVWKNRLSQVSIGSDTSNEECTLSKSASVGLIGSSTDDNQHLGGYVSLPRNVSRSGKIISKFGFSTLASKFRKVKMRRTSKDNTTKMTAVSALCRQSLAIDIASNDNENLNSDQRKSMETESNLMKSGSTQAIMFGTLFRKNDKDKLNKSKSTGSVLNDEHFNNLGNIDPMPNKNE